MIDARAADDPWTAAASAEWARLQERKPKIADTGAEVDLGLITDADLDTLELPAPKWIISDYLAEGLVILAGKPKLGKSWLALGLAYAVATGGKALNAIEVDQGDVLCLALEDTRRRLQVRMKAIRQGDPPTERLHFRTAWPRLNDGGLEMIRVWLQSKPEARLVIVDTFAKVKARSTGRGTQYEEDYDSLSGLKALADEFNVGIVVVTHTRKTPAEDVYDEIIGGVGLTGSADASLVLKRERGQADGFLHATGRDIEEREAALMFHKDTGLWSLLGDAEDYRRSKEQNEILRCIIDNEAMTPKEIAERLGKHDSTMRSLLSKMRDARLVKRREDGRYVAEE